MKTLEQINKELDLKRKKQAKQSWISKMKALEPQFTKRGHKLETVIKFN